MTISSASFIIALMLGQMEQRTPWISPPLPPDMELPSRIVKVEDLPQNSGYKILLRALESPSPEKRKPRIWATHWSDASEKLRRYGWPKQRPPSIKQRPRNISSSAPWTLEQCQDIMRLFELYKPKIALLDQAIAAPNSRLPTETLATERTGIISMGGKFRNMTRWLSVSASYRMARGDYAGSLRDMERALEMSDRFLQSGILTMLNKRGCQGLAIGVARNLAMQKHTPPALLRKTARLFFHYQEHNLPFSQHLQQEYALIRSHIPAYYAQCDMDTLLQQRNFYFFDAKKNEGQRASALLLLALAGSTPKTSEANLNACYQHLLKIAENPYSAETLGKYRTLKQRLELPEGPGKLYKTFVLTPDPFGYIFVNKMMLERIPSAHRHNAEHEARLRAMALFAALKAYEKEKGTVPQTLAELVPEYLPDLPKDPFDQKPFRYRPSNVPHLPASAWAVYSVGENFSDDGGDAKSIGWHSHHAPDKRGLTKNPDLVWPSHPYPRA